MKKETLRQATKEAAAFSKLAKELVRLVDELDKNDPYAPARKHIVYPELFGKVAAARLSARKLRDTLRKLTGER